MAGMSRVGIAGGPLERYRKVLLRKAEEVRLGLGAHRAAAAALRPEEPLDFGDWCQKNHDEWLFLNQNRLEVALLRELEQALDRVRDGSYGLCQNCGEPIAHRRLEAVPWARCCVACQEQTGPAAVLL